MRSIGFSEIRKRDMENLIKDIVELPEIMAVAKSSEGEQFAEFRWTFAPGMGIVVRGTYDEEDVLKPEYCVPYLEGFTKTTGEIIEVEKLAEKEAYAGIGDDPNLGLTLIFYVNNVIQYLNANREDPLHGKCKGARLAALGIEGRIILPVEKKKAKSKFTNENRNKLLAEAKEGSDEALQDLTMQDMDMFNMLTRRLMKEDILSIVSTTFMPYGVESDQYGILAEILEYELIENQLTGEQVYLMKVQTNNLVFNLCINEKDVMGVPEVGRRIKANIWLQGDLCVD